MIIFPSNWSRHKAGAVSVECSTSHRFSSQALHAVCVPAEQFRARAVLDGEKFNLSVLSTRNSTRREFSNYLKHCYYYRCQVQFMQMQNKDEHVVQVHFQRNWLEHENGSSRMSEEEMRWDEDRQGPPWVTMWVTWLIFLRIRQKPLHKCTILSYMVVLEDEQVTHEWIRTAWDENWNELTHSSRLVQNVESTHKEYEEKVCHECWAPNRVVPIVRGL